MALEGLHRPFFWGITNYRKENVTLEELTAPVDAVINAAFAEKDFIEVLESLQEPIKSIWQDNHDARLEVEVSADKLMQLGEGTLSTLKLKMSVRNHMWTEVKTEEHRSTRV